jgi:predicted  nucleic acid-binding Zn-ribbon protein
VNILTLWPYLLIVPAFLLGLLLGWYLRPAFRRQHGDSSPDARSARQQAEKLQNAGAEAALLDERLISLNQTITASRQQLEQLDKEHQQLLVAIDDRRAEIVEARSKLHSFEKNFESQQSEMLANIDASGEEYEMLQQLDSRYTSRIAHMTQKIQLLDRDLQTLRQSITVKEAEIEKARQLANQRDAELKRLIRQHQQRETDLDRTREQLSRRNDELRRLLDSRSRDELFEDPHPGANVPARRRKDVTPLTRPQLDSGNSESSDS